MHYVENKMRTHLSIVDKLTGVYNRFQFDQTLEAWCSPNTGAPRLFSVILFDLDHFKRVNDQYGHLVGDTTLVSVASLVQESIRDGDIFARWGGEEFVILLPNHDFKSAQHLAERLCRNIEAHSFEAVLRVTASFGVVTYHDGDTPISIIQRVDKALYTAKQTGRNKVCGAAI